MAIEMHRNRLRDLRKANKLTVEKIAEKLDISASYYYDLEKSQKRLNEDLLNKVADYYDCTTDYILGRVDDPHHVIIDNNNLPEELKPFLEYIVEIRNNQITPEHIRDILEFIKKTKNF